MAVALPLSLVAWRRILLVSTAFPFAIAAGFTQLASVGVITPPDALSAASAFPIDALAIWTAYYLGNRPIDSERVVAVVGVALGLIPVAIGGFHRLHEGIPVAVHVVSPCTGSVPDMSLQVVKISGDYGLIPSPNVLPPRLQQAAEEAVQRGDSDSIVILDGQPLRGYDEDIVGSDFNYLVWRYLPTYSPGQPALPFTGVQLEYSGWNGLKDILTLGAAIKPSAHVSTVDLPCATH